MTFMFPILISLQQRITARRFLVVNAGGTLNVGTASGDNRPPWPGSPTSFECRRDDQPDRSNVNSVWTLTGINSGTWLRPALE
jgi:hypothetical protein